jgi:hypothetical protein
MVVGEDGRESVQRLFAVFDGVEGKAMKIYVASFLLLVGFDVVRRAHCACERASSILMWFQKPVRKLGAVWRGKEWKKDWTG